MLCVLMTLFFMEEGNSRSDASTRGNKAEASLGASLWGLVKGEGELLTSPQTDYWTWCLRMNRSSHGWLLLVVCFAWYFVKGEGSLWENWWTYEGISGPQFWGFINQRWIVCSKGRNQSPINVEPSNLLFDPTLSPLLLFGDLMTGTLRNNGHDITFSVQHNGNPRYDGVNITGGPLSYIYRVDQIRFHFSLADNEGSEHSIGRNTFPVEMQILAYNADLYSNYSEAESSPKGLAAIAVFAQVSDRTHKEFTVFQRAINTTLYKGDWTYIERLRLRQLMPPTDQYVTYEGSITTPGCHETVTWLIYNRPIYISKKQLSTLRSLRQDTVYNPVMLMAPNIRPVQSLNQRTPRTNINFRERKCTMMQNMYYQVNDRVADRDVR